MTSRPFCVQWEKPGMICHDLVGAELEPQPPMSEVVCTWGLCAGLGHCIWVIQQRLGAWVLDWGVMGIYFLFEILYPSDKVDGFFTILLRPTSRGDFAIFLV